MTLDMDRTPLGAYAAEGVCGPGVKTARWQGAEPQLWRATARFRNAASGIGFASGRVRLLPRRLLGRGILRGCGLQNQAAFARGENPIAAE
jgi:hypothetical protein